MQRFEIWETDPPAVAERTTQVIGVTGEVDLMTADVFRNALLRALSDGSSDVEIDLSSVEFMDAAGVSALVEAWTRATASGHRLIVRRPSPPVRRVVRLCGLDGQLLADEH